MNDLSLRLNPGPLLSKAGPLRAVQAGGCFSPGFDVFGLPCEALS